MMSGKLLGGGLALALSKTAGGEVLPTDRNVVSLLIMAWCESDLLGVISAATDVNSRGFETWGRAKIVCTRCVMWNTFMCTHTHA